MRPFVPLVDPPSALVGELARWYIVRRSELLTTPEGTVPVAYGLAELRVETEGPAVFLGLDGEVPCWAVGVADDAADPEPLWWQALWVLGMEWDTDAWMLAGRAVQLVEWVRTNRYCGRCATPMVEAAGERARRCPTCALTAYPRLAPAVIVLIRRGEEALLAMGRGFGQMYSTLAGFVEPGENLEEAVRREVFEEVGVTLGRVDYVGSQPWPFPHSLMVGFDAEWESGEIAVDGTEIIDAGWYRRHDLPRIPPTMSIARRLIDRWIAGA